MTRLIGPFAYWLALAAAGALGVVLWLAWLAGCALLGLLRLPFRAARRRRVPGLPEDGKPLSLAGEIAIAQAEKADGRDPEAAAAAARAEDEAVERARQVLRK